MNKTEKFAIISEEELVRARLDINKSHEEKALADLKRVNHKFTNWVWQYDGLIVTYDEVKEK